ncbi:MAG: glycine oxidase [Candidatus Azotimanducaceae bacterium]
MTTADITIRGAGILGLSIAWACTLRGAKVYLVDPNGPASGSSGGIVGALSPHVPERWDLKKQFQLESLLMAQGFWDKVAEHGGLSAGYMRTGRLQPIATDNVLALSHTRTQSAQQLWQGQAAWTVIPVDQSNPWAPHSPTGMLIHDDLSAHMHPRQACAALVAALSAKGVEVQTDAPMRGPTIWATGVQGLLDLSKTYDHEVGAGEKGQAALLKFDMPNAPQLYADYLHVIPHEDGTVGVGSTSERYYDDPTTTDAQLDDIIDRIRVALPILADAPVIERWAGLRPRSRTRAPMLGAWPDRPNHFVANGGFKIAFGMAPKIAEVMADLTLEGRNNIPDIFDIQASLKP